MKLVGILVGLLGVGVLAGVHPEGGGWAVAGTLAVVLASISYAAGGLYGQHALGRCIRAVLATASMLYGGLLLLPFALFQLPDPRARLEAGALALRAGRARHRRRAAAPVQDPAALRRGAALARHYLIPAFALLYGSLILDEPLRPSMLVGLGLILGGVGARLGSASGAGSVGRCRVAVKRRRRRASPRRRGRRTSTSSPGCCARGGRALPLRPCAAGREACSPGSSGRSASRGARRVRDRGRRRARAA